MAGPSRGQLIIIDPTIASETALERYRSRLGLAVALPGRLEEPARLSCKRKQDPDHVSLSERCHRAGCGSLVSSYTQPYNSLGIQGKGILHKDGELSNFNCECTHKCCRAIRHLDHEYSTRSIEAVVKANSDRHRWYQLYWYVPHPPGHTYCTVFPHLRCSKPATNQRGGVLDPSSVAEAEGFMALVVTRYLPTRLVGLTTSTWPTCPS